VPASEVEGGFPASESAEQVDALVSGEVGGGEFGDGSFIDGSLGYVARCHQVSRPLAHEGFVVVVVSTHG
jgi:hypothetical protein